MTPETVPQVRINAYCRGAQAGQMPGCTETDNPYHPGAACLWLSWLAGFRDERA